MSNQVRDKIFAPFTDEQVAALNDYQQHGNFHPFTCCGYEGCKRALREDGGILIASNDGWKCPCGKWEQTWAHSFMANSK